MHYGAIKEFDIADGIGTRVTVFVSGCTNRCEGCFQPETWDFEFGQPFTKETEDYVLKCLEPYYIHGLTILGGEPFEPSNQRALLPFLKRFKEMYPNKDLWMFTGFRYEDELIKPGSHPNCEVTDEILSLVNILVDGRFILSKKDIRLKFRGSSNQRIIDMVKTRETGEIVLWDDSIASE